MYIFFYFKYSKRDITENVSGDWEHLWAEVTKLALLPYLALQSVLFCLFI